MKNNIYQCAGIILLLLILNCCSLFQSKDPGSNKIQSSSLNPTLSAIEVCTINWQSKNLKAGVDYSTNEIIVSFGINTNKAKEIVNAYGLIIRDILFCTSTNCTCTINIPNGEIFEWICRFTYDTNVSYAEPDYILHLD